MILEVAILNIKKGKWKEFERAFFRAQTIISSIQGAFPINYKNVLKQKIVIFFWLSGKL